MPKETGYRARVEDLFHEAMARQSEEARIAFLDGACQGDPALRSEVDALLSSQGKIDSYLENPPPLAETVASSDATGEGTQIGNYKLLQKLGEGGFGLVYMAQQTQPVRRQVAIKIIKPGMDSKEVIARFEAERQALAMMEHPSIAKVLDAGTTDEGRPYFVMELVKGKPITEYCDKNQLPTRARLELFVQVCNAVQHAHQKGIIHRDLKPSNVMVTLHDGKPVPKVIDFGVSKALSQQLTDKTLFTRYGQIIGTPQYMSPEQAEMSGLDIDTRSDIYSLGVLLYELLTGHTPFDSDTLRQAGFEGMRKLICESEPAKPSTKVKTLAGQSATLVANDRASAIGTLSKTFVGDLDWIVMKSLDKDRSRRYETASSFVQDIERHLTDQPVQAGPPSLAYQLSKLYRRHRGAVSAAACIAATVVIATVVAFAGWLSASHSGQLASKAKKQAIAAEAEALKNAAAALASKSKAEKERDRFRQSLGLATEIIRRTAKLFTVDEAEEYLSSTLGLLRESESNPVAEVELLILLGEVHGRNYVTATKFANEACRLASELDESQKRELNRNPYLLHCTLLAEQDLLEAVDIANQAISFAESYLDYAAHIEAICKSAQAIDFFAPATSVGLRDQAARLAIQKNDISGQWAVWDLSINMLNTDLQQRPFQRLLERKEEVEQAYNELTRLQGVQQRMLPTIAGSLAAMLFTFGSREEANQLLDSELATPSFHKNFGETSKDLGELALADEHLRIAGSVNQVWVPIDRARILLLGRRYGEATALYQRSIGINQNSKDRNKIWVETWLKFELACVKTLIGEEQDTVFREVYDVLKDFDNSTLYGNLALPVTLLAGTWGGIEDSELELLYQELRKRNLTLEEGQWMDLGAIAEFEMRKGKSLTARNRLIESKRIQQGAMAGTVFSNLFEQHLYEELQDAGYDGEELRLLESDIDSSDRNFAPNHPRRAFSRIRYLQAITDEALSSETSQEYLVEAQRIFEYHGEWIAEAEREALDRLLDREGLNS